MEMESENLPYELPTTKEGKPNRKYIDFLQQDTPIAGQSHCVVSFISPESIVKSAELFFFEKYVQQFGMDYFFKHTEDFFQFIRAKYGLNSEKFREDLKDYMTHETEIAKKLDLFPEYRAFVRDNEKELREEYKKKNPMHGCTVRAIKVRGVSSTQSGAEEIANEKRREEPHVSSFVGPVGMWMVFDPTGATKTEYMEPQLNKLYQDKILSQKKAEEEFQARVRDKKLEALENNEKIVEKYGGKRTQTIDENGNLININAITPSMLDEREEAESGEKGTMDKNIELRNNIIKAQHSEEEADKLINNLKV